MSDWTEGKNFSGQTIRNIDLSNAKIVGANLQNTRLSGMINGLVLNDVEVAPLIDAELTRLHPERAKLRPLDLQGCREAVAILDAQLESTYERSLAFREEQRHQRVDDEWSLVESIRHLVMVLDGWFSRTIRGEEDPFHPIGLTPSFMPPKPEGTSIDPDADPTFEEARDVLRDRMGAFRAYVDDLVQEELSRPIDNFTGSVHGSLWVIFDELWAHNRFINRDLDVIEKAS
jgi:DinB family protein/pentapeptide repeat protein